MEKCKVEAVEKKIEGHLQHKDKEILTYSISYPQFQSSCFRQFIHWLNQFYHGRATTLARYCGTSFYSEALAAHQEAERNNLPIHPYNFVEAFEMHYGEDCAISLCIDRGVYTSGANGSSLRRADNWNLVESRKITLKDLYPTNTAYKQQLLTEIQRQIQQQQRDGAADYLEGANHLAEENFDENSFFLDDKSLHLFFQPITIAPHSSGFPEFKIALSSAPIWPVRCV